VKVVYTLHTEHSALFFALYLSTLLTIRKHEKNRKARNFCPICGLIKGSRLPVLAAVPPITFCRYGIPGIVGHENAFDLLKRSALMTFRHRALRRQRDADKDRPARAALPFPVQGGVPPANKPLVPASSKDATEETANTPTNRHSIPD